MSVIVKNMEMPKNCRTCPMLFDGHSYRWCNITGESLGIEETDNGRNEYCPLVQIPTPHGRLGDLDKLNIHDISPVDGFCVMGVTEEDIELADTVIEAEGETDA